MATVVLVGAGQLGSRHLQALKAVATPLDIHVVEPRADALKIARERYDAVKAAAGHRIAFRQDLSKLPPIDVAIVADVMVPPVQFRVHDDVRTAALGLVASNVRAAPVLDDAGKIIGMIDQLDIVRALTAVGVSSP